MRSANSPGAAGVPAYRIAPGPPGEAFYSTEYLKLIKTLVVMDATVAEAQDAAQKALKDLFERSRTATAPISNPAAWVRRAAIRFFIKDRQRDRERPLREINGGHLTLPAALDHELTAWEDEQWVEQVLESLTPAQRDVIRLVMDGASTQEIAGQLGKTDATVRQHLFNARDRLKVHPEIAPRAATRLQSQNRPPGEPRSAAPPAPRKEEVQ